MLLFPKCDVSSVMKKDKVCKKFCKRHRGKIIVTGVVSLAVCGVMMLPRREINVAEDPQHLQTVKVRTLAARECEHRIILRGTVQPWISTHLHAQISGTIERICHDRGAFVRAGDDLVVITDDVRSARVEAARAAAQKAKLEFEASKRLTAESHHSPLNFATAHTSYRQTLSDLRTAEFHQSNTHVKAPYDGVVVDRSVMLGDYVTANSQLMRFAQIDPLRVTVFCNEREISHLSVGMKADVLIGERRSEGKVATIAPDSDQKTRCYRVDIELPNKDLCYMSGMSATAYITIAHRNGYRIPLSAICLNDNGDMCVKTLDSQNIVHTHIVQPFSYERTHAMIAGLPDKIRLITVGMYYVVDGAKVLSQEDR